MLRSTPIVITSLLILATAMFGRDRYLRDVDIPNPDESSAVLRFLGIPAEVAVIDDEIVPRMHLVATSRWTYYFLSSRGSVHPISFYFVRGRWEKRDEISQQHYERFRLLQADRLEDARLILRYKRTHSR
jgi:hypothetical protein